MDYANVKKEKNCVVNEPLLSLGTYLAVRGGSSEEKWVEIRERE